MYKPCLLMKLVETKNGFLFLDLRLPRDSIDLIVDKKGTLTLLRCSETKTRTKTVV